MVFRTLAPNVMEKLVKFNNQSAGRDKLFRLIQYSSRIIWANLEKKTSNKDLISKLKNLEYALSTARKLYRFGRCTDTLHSVLNSMHLDDPFLHYTITFSRISMAVYLLIDHVIWLGRVGLADINSTKWSKRSYEFWLFYLTMNLARDMYEITKIINRFNCPTSKEINYGRVEYRNSAVSKLCVLFDLLKMNKDIAVDTIKNSCDVCLHLAQLGYLSISPRTVGILGVISSVAGMLPLLDASYKMAP